MNLFTEVWDESRAIVTAHQFDQRWSNMMPKLKALFGADGPVDTEAGVLELVRSSLKQAAAKNPGHPAQAIADEILALSKTDVSGFQKRAAFIKLLQHFYFVEKKGNQTIWVIDHPDTYPSWCYDHLEAMPEHRLKTELKSDNEAFGDFQRQVMSDSLQLSRKWCMDILVKLGAMDADTKSKVDRWFFAGTPSDADRNAAVTKLKDGFKKIADLCNTTKVIFSDRPHKRMSPENATLYASVNSGDRLPVIYIYKLFMDAGKAAHGEVGKLWLSALTIIHELSHKLVGNKDLGYDYQGLKPGGVYTKAADAIKNADSWGYFAADLVGALSAEKLAEVYK